jgi:hypothetical protein
VIAKALEKRDRAGCAEERHASRLVVDIGILSYLGVLIQEPAMRIPSPLRPRHPVSPERLQPQRLQLQRLQVRLGSFMVRGDGSMAVLAAAVVALALIALSLK